MRRSFTRLLCLMGVLVLLACGAYALSSGDSLVSLRYLREVFMPGAVEQGSTAANSKLQETYDAAKSTLDELQAGYTGQAGTGGSYSASLQARDWSEGDTVEIGTGSGLLMLEGTAWVTHNGVLVDVTEGTEVASGSMTRCATSMKTACFPACRSTSSAPATP